MDVFIVGLFGAFAMFPKDPALAPPGTARWLAHFYVAKEDLEPTPRLKAIFLCSIFFYLAVIWLAGPMIVHLMVSRGIVLAVMLEGPLPHEFRASNVTSAVRSEYNSCTMYTSCPNPPSSPSASTPN